ncbi:FapA family protein [Patescibacteria group bacterium]|nr:FapA family protein [Patescibacteria group bacterium]
MKRKAIFSVVLTSLIATLFVAGAVYAASEINITEKLGGKDGDFFNVDGTMMMDSVKIGRQGEGGVTFFNGTIVNITTNDGVDNPVAFGDNVRIDGRIWRGATSGPEAADAENPMPVIVNDDLQVKGKTTLEGDVSFTSGKTVDFTGATVNGLTTGTAEYTSYMRVPGSAFKAEDSAIVGYSYTGGALDANSDATSVTTYAAPVNLPNGAKITELSMRANDLDAATSVKAWLNKIDSNYTSSTVATLETGASFSGGDTTVSTTMDHTVVNESSSYYVRGEFEKDDNKIYDLRVKYTVSNPY